jgi:hypothetical protein
MKRWSLTVVPLAAGLLLWPPTPHPPSSAWGANGHRIVAQIAERHLLPLAQLRIRELIGPYPLARISVWADEYRGTPEGEHTATWHYVNVPDGAEYREPETDRPTDIVQALRLQERILRDTARTREEHVRALKLLVHFVADIHQPMHVGRASDRGGNDVDVRWFGRTVNLHSLWDSHILDHQQLSYTEYVAFLDFASADEIAGWQATGYVDWLRESQDLRAEVYAPIDAAGDEVPNLGWGYFNTAIPIVERRLLQAGIRLAGVLNEIFGE